jgi:hypothetical protein
MVALPNDRDAKRRVQLSVAAAMQAVSISCVPGAARDRGSTIEARERARVAEAAASPAWAMIVAARFEPAPWRSASGFSCSLNSSAISRPKSAMPGVEIRDVPRELANAASRRACEPITTNPLSQQSRLRRPRPPSSPSRPDQQLAHRAAGTDWNYTSGPQAYPQRRHPPCAPGFSLLGLSIFSIQKHSPNFLDTEGRAMPM